MNDDFLKPLRERAGVEACFIDKVEGVDVLGERDEVLARLEPYHQAAVQREFGVNHWWRAEQVHGADVAVVPVLKGADDPFFVHGVDGLLSIDGQQVLGVYVADCGAIWLADRVTGAVGLLHSGRKGTELKILEEAVQMMRERFGTKPEDLVGVLGPCIRPPHYEIDFAADIALQAADLGVLDFTDCGIDTAECADYYSYRMEKGRTGRMLALIRGASHS